MLNSVPDIRPLPIGNPYPETRPRTFDAAWALYRIHRIAENLGYERIRIDRGVLPSNFKVYYEAGYGPLSTVHMTTSRGEVYQITKENWEAMSDLAISDMLVRNKQGYE